MRLMSSFMMLCAATRRWIYRLFLTMWLRISEMRRAYRCGLCASSVAACQHGAGNLAHARNNWRGSYPRRAGHYAGAVLDALAQGWPDPFAASWSPPNAAVVAQAA
jgi:hypothetical protein